LFVTLLAITVWLVVGALLGVLMQRRRKRTPSRASWIAAATIGGGVASLFPALFLLGLPHVTEGWFGLAVPPLGGVAGYLVGESAWFLHSRGTRRSSPA